MEVQPSIRVTYAEVFLLATQFAANPPDGAVTLSAGKGGGMYAEWSCGGRPVSIGYPAAPRPV